MSEPLLTIDDATREFRVSAKTIRRRLTAGEVEGAYKRPGTRGPEWVMPRSSLLAAGFDVREGAPAEALPEDDGARADYWARRALDAEAALRTTTAIVPPSPADRRGRALGRAGILVLLALAAGLLLGRATGDEAGRPSTDGALGAATSLLASLTGDGDPIGHVGPVAADALPEGRTAVPIEELEDARDVRYVLVAGRASARPVVDELEETAAAVLRLPADDVVVLDTALPASPVEADESPDAQDAAGPGAEDIAAPEDGAPGEPTGGAPVDGPGAGESPAAGGPESSQDPVPSTGPPTPPAPGPATAPGVEAQREGPAVATGADGDRRVTVAPGDSFWTIAEGIAAERGGDVTATWAHLIAANADRLVQPGNPDLVHVGQTLLVPARR